MSYITNNNILMKSETLKNMMNKLTEEAKNQLQEGEQNNNIFNKSIIYQEDKIFTENMFDNFGNNMNNGEELKIFNINPNPEDNYENFTQEYYMERYKKFIPSNLVTPTDFSTNLNIILEPKFINDFSVTNTQNKVKMPQMTLDLKKGTTKSNISPKTTNILLTENLFDLVQSKINSNKLESKLINISIFNWIRIYNELNQTSKINLDIFIENLSSKKFTSIYSKLESFFSLYGIDTKKEIIICEVCKIKFIDCLQIIELKDFNLCKREYIVTEQEISKDNISESRSLVLKDNQFRENEVILIQSSGLKQMTIYGGKSFHLVSFKSIKQLS
jgi:hypothetical protein